MQLTILGCHSATPRANAHPTSQVLDMNGELMLIDCGEGTQVRLRREKIKFSRIRHIFISHLHGDHYYGLIGLLSTFSLLNRTAELHIHAPQGLEEIIKLQLRVSHAYTSYPLIFHQLDSRKAELILDNDKLSVETIPLSHRVYTNGFLFKAKPGDRKLLIDKVQNLDIDKAYYKSIVKGKDVETRDGRLVRNEDLTADPRPEPSYAFCSDTVFKPDIVPQITGTTLLYHESTFLEEQEHLCEKTKHSTAKQAGIIAQKAGVQKLILGHFSARYKNLSLFEKEAQVVFDNVENAESGKIFRFE
ncbi:ribonuclease Z [Psychroflexus sp. YR1-1]|uniref:Ribonuclease Z n=1 Tax=Psychroflexus aurantiacus TaxID=2709310 RepID=A0A6B3R640_9FLAO|nr:ribonuclease Z [Psychroflexus aurantiacus]NEV93291.1 ribonuclease Z [Psychroflexus aurantiacus]